MFCTVTNKSVSFFKPVATPSRRPTRIGRANFVIRPVKCQIADANLSTEQIPADIPTPTTSADVAQVDQTQNSRREINEKLKEANTPADYVLVFREEQEDMDPINVSVAAKAWLELLFDYRREAGKSSGDSESSLLEEKEKLYEGFEELVSMIEKTCSEQDARGVMSCMKSLASGNLFFDGRFENFSLVMTKLVERAVEIKNSFGSGDLVKLLFVSTHHYDAYKESNDELVEVVKKFDVSKDLNRFRLEEVLYIMANIDSYDIDYCTQVIEVACKRYFASKKDIFVKNFVNACLNLRIYNAEIFQVMLSHMENSDRLNGIRLVNFVSLTAALAPSLYERNKMIDGILEVLQQNREYRVYDLAFIFYYFACLGAPSEKINIIRNLLEESVKNDFENITQAEGGIISHALQICKAQDIQVELPEQLVEVCKQQRKEYINKQVEYTQNNAFVVEVYNKIKEKFEQAQLGAAVADEQMNVSILLQSGENNFAIEPLTSKMFVKNNDQGLSAIKQADLDVLSSLGYKVVPVSELQWKDNAVYQEEIMNSLQ